MLYLENIAHLSVVSLLFTIAGVFGTSDIATGKVHGDGRLTGFLGGNRSHSRNNHDVDSCPSVTSSSLCCFVSVSAFLSLQSGLHFSSVWLGEFIFSVRARRSI